MPETSHGEDETQNGQSATIAPSSHHRKSEQRLTGVDGTALTSSFSSSSHARWLDDYLRLSAEHRPSSPTLTHLYTHDALSPIPPHSTPSSSTATSTSSSTLLPPPSLHPPDGTQSPPSLYPSTRPLPLPGPGDDPSAIYIRALQLLVDFHVISQSTAYQEAVARPFGLLEVSSTPCAVCEFPSPQFLSEADAFRVSHALCRLQACLANTILKATGATQLTMLTSLERGWGCAITAASTGDSAGDAEPHAVVRYIAEGDDRWKATMPMTVLDHVSRTRTPLSVYAPVDAPSPSSPFPASFYSDPFFVAFPVRPSFHCLPIVGDHSNLHTILFLLSTSPLPTPASHPFHNLHLPGLHLLASQLSGVYRNAQLMTRLDCRVQRHTSDLERELEERRRVEVELTQAKAAADRNAAVKSEFLSNMSHEIRTPMNAVLGAARLLGSTPLSAEQSHYLQLISTSGKLLLSLIGDILDINRIESGHMQLEARPFHLTDCIETAVHLCHSTATQKGLDLAMVCDSTVPPSIEGDLTRLSQIIINLLSNSTKFTDAGYIMVSVRAKDKGPLPLPQTAIEGATLGDMDKQKDEKRAAGEGASLSTVGALPSISPPFLTRSLTAPTLTSLVALSSASKDASPVSLRRLVEVEIHVTDTGIGMSAEVQSRLFQVFSQGDASIVRRHGGSGLGLVISQRLAEKMNGRITVQSELGVGSTFLFTFQAPATLPSIWHPLLRQQQPSGDGLPAASSLSFSPAFPFPVPGTYAYSLATPYSSALFNQRCLIICPTQASARAYASLCIGYGMRVTSTTNMVLAFPKTPEEEREEEDERRRLEEDRARRNLPLQRIIGRTATTTPRTPSQPPHSHLDHSDSGSESGRGGAGGGASDSDREGSTPREAKDTRLEEPKIITPRLTLIVPPRFITPSAHDGTATPTSAVHDPDIILIVSHPQLERERQRELTRLVRGLNARATLAYAAALGGDHRRSFHEEHSLTPSTSSDSLNEVGDAVTTTPPALPESGRRKRRRSVLADGRGRLRRPRLSLGCGVGTGERLSSLVVEIRLPVKNVFVLKAMAKMLMKRDKEAHERRRPWDDDHKAAQKEGESSDSPMEGTQPLDAVGGTRAERKGEEQQMAADVDDDGEDDGEEGDEEEPVTIDEMQDDEAVNEDTEQQKTRSHYRHHDPLPPLSTVILSPSSPSTPPPSLPSPPVLTSTPMSPFSTPSPQNASASSLSTPPASTSSRPARPSSRSRHSHSFLASTPPSDASPAAPFVLKGYASGTRTRPMHSIPLIAPQYPLQLLLAEDNKVNQRVMTMLLAKLGYHGVKVACNGQEVIEELRTTRGWRNGGAAAPYHVVLMDCQMDLMDGFVCAQLIRENEAPHWRHVILAQTANVSSQDACERAGMDGFVSKPISVEELQRQLIWAYNTRMGRSTTAQPRQ